jgi:hypothetical protein
MMRAALSFKRVIFILLCSPVLAWADDRMVVGDFSRGANASGVPNEWQLKEKSGKADFSLIESDGVHALQLRSTNTSFSFQKQIKADLKDFPILCWKWKVSSLPTGGDFRHTKTDDQAAQLFVAFGKARAIVYLWDTTAPAGLMADAPSPPFMSIKAVVVRSGRGELGKWLTESRNVYEDYQRLYGAGDKPPVVGGMRLQINTQHTKSSAESCFADVVFTAVKSR